MRWIVLIVTVMLLSSCAQWKKCNRANRKIARALELCPDFASRQIDTLLVKVPAKSGEFETRLPTITINELPPALGDAIAKSDTVEVLRWMNKPCFEDTISFEDDHLSLQMYFDENDSLRIPYEIKESQEMATYENMVITPGETRDMPYRWWEVVLMVLGGCFIVYLFLMGGLINKK